MQGLRDIGHTLPPGFKFYPSDEELVCHYLYKKISNEQVDRGTLVEIDLHTCEPWQLPDVAKLNSSEWYFFSFRDRKYSTGFRANRATTSGYWKATGKDRAVLSPVNRAVVGMRKTLVFYGNRAPNGIKSGWIMHEFRVENPYVPPKEEWVLCRVFHKSGGDNSSNNNNNNNNNNNIWRPRGDDALSAADCNNYYFPNTTQPHDHVHHLKYQHELQGPLGSSADEHPSTSCHDHKVVSDGIDRTKCEDDYGFLFDMGFEFDVRNDSNGNSVY